MSSLIVLNNVKEVCRYCKGSGIIVYPKEVIGTVCSCCRGKGYFLIDSSNIVSISKATDILSMDAYRLKTIHNLIRTFSLYEGIVLVNDVKYVAFANKGLLGTARQWYEGIEDNRVVTYEEYISGKLPLPDEKSLCPQSFADYPFDSCKECSLVCNSQQRVECWNKFYEGCNSLEKKQETVVKYVRSLKPRRTLS